MISLTIYMMRKNKTLLQDVSQVYYSMKCEIDYNKQSFSCKTCENNRLCNITENLIKSIKKLY